jgi:hypothetical protein
LNGGLQFTSLFAGKPNAQMFNFLRGHNKEG